jgi:hypothetical protein
MSSFLGSDLLRVGKYHVFHDESEPRPNKGWLLIGLTFVKEGDLEIVRNCLMDARNSEQYDGEVHFCELPKSFGGAFGAKARVARKWLRAYQQGLFDLAHFSVLAVNRDSPRFEHNRFRADFHAYNRFTAMAIKAGISWHLLPYAYDQIELTIISDGKDRKSNPDQGLVDNFESYIPYRVSLDTLVKQNSGIQKYPDVNVKSVRTPSSHTDDILQLTDLILGAFQSGLVDSSKKPTKSYVAKAVAAWYQDLQFPPWKQTFKMHRKFNAWGFPDENGLAFNQFEMRILQRDNDQLTLF